MGLSRLAQGVPAHALPQLYPLPLQFDLHPTYLTSTLRHSLVIPVAIMTYILLPLLQRQFVPVLVAPIKAPLRLVEAKVQVQVLLVLRL